MIRKWLGVVSILFSKFALLRSRRSNFEVGLKLDERTPSIPADYLKAAVGSNFRMRTLILCAAITMPAASVFAQDQCFAHTYSHYGSFAEPVTGRGTANRGPLIFGTAQAALDAAVAWVPLVDGDIVFASRCGADMTWRLGEEISRESTRTDYAILTDVDTPHCAEVFKNARIGAVRCIHAQNLVLQLLVAPLETRPSGTGGVSTIPLTAKVTSGATPQSGVALSFSVDVTANSGGHDHHNAVRKLGDINPIQGTTDANGEVKVTFKAPEAAGIHTFKATCASCSNSPATKEIQVKVPNLVEMLPDTAKPATYTLVGATGNHKSNHWFSSDSVATLHKVADAMFKTGWGAVGVNDGSLVWGGLFDIKGGWTPSHHEHRTGTEVDLSVTNPRNITDEQKKKTYAELCKANNTGFSIQTLWHQDDGYPEHFHMYLDGTGLDSQAKGGPCCARYKTTRAKVDKNGKPVLDKNGKPVQETVALCEETSPR